MHLGYTFVVKKMAMRETKGSSSTADLKGGGGGLENKLEVFLSMLPQEAWRMVGSSH